MSNTQYLIRTAAGMDYARVEQWQGGKSAAVNEASRIGGFVVELDETLCPTDTLVADFRKDR